MNDSPVYGGGKRRARTLAVLSIPAALSVGLAALPAPVVAAQETADVLGAGTDYLDPGEATPLAAQSVEYPEVQGLPEGVSVDRVEWLSNRRVAVYVNSAAMPGDPIQVQILLARDWYSDPSRTFPEVWALDGLRAQDDENGWTIATNIEQFYADKNVNVVLPVGGPSSFYTDWEQEDNGVHYMWETFLTSELLPILTNQFRSNGQRAVVGLSMGGTAAMNLAERHPELFDFVGSFSGYLDTTSPGMPAAIAYALRDGGNFDATKMWGPLGSHNWQDHDPKLNVAALQGKTVYVSSGNGRDDYGEVGSVATGPANASGVGLEAVARMTSQTFVNRAEKAGISVIERFRPAGVHNWPYWQYEMTQAWPYIADTFGLSEADRGVSCNPIGAIADALQTVDVGACLNDEYDVAEGAGKAEDFQNGTAYWSPETGAQVLYGRINGRYSELGGPSSELGFPITGELGAPDSTGRFTHFQNGSIYWTPDTGAVVVPAAFFNAWGAEGWETGRLGYPTAAPEDIAGGQLQRFQNGVIVQPTDGAASIVAGEIGAAWQAAGAENSPVGLPTDGEVAIPGGVLQRFQNGTYYWTPQTGAHYILNGQLYDAWGEHGYEQGEYGWPTSDQVDDYITFEHGALRLVEGAVQEER